MGAGPKGLAVGVKAKVLEELGLPIDRVVLIERHRAGAHWSGDFGYTDGELKLGTSPEKDLVFPLETEVGDPELDRRIRARLMSFTWTAFLVDTRRYPDWIDRGRPSPSHQLWAAYLAWVAAQLAPEVTLLSAEVRAIDLDAAGARWELALCGPSQPSSLQTFAADGLMLTGPGKTRMDFAGWSHGDLPPRTYDLESFWSTLKAGGFTGAGRVGVVGAGENAASVLLALGRRRPQLELEVISPKGFLATRAESSYENRFYSRPQKTGWEDLALADRLDFIERTDLGVFSTHAMSILDDETQHRVVPGRLVGIASDAKGLTVELEHRGLGATRAYDHVILATGFDHLGTLRSLLSTRATGRLEDALGMPLEASALAQRIGPDLAVQGLHPRIHLPSLAALMQGPGFANLSCLGLLADRVLFESQSARARAELTHTEAIG